MKSMMISSSTYKLRITSEKFDLAKSSLFKFEGKEIEGEGGITTEVKQREIVIASDVPLESYLRFCNNERKYPVNIRLVKGKVIAYEIHHAPHGIAQTCLSFLMHDWSDQLICCIKLDIT